MLNEYYIDPSARINGIGSKSSPFNTVSMIESTQLVAPMAVYIRRGTRERGNWKINHAGFLNQAQQSYITAYGDGPAPVLLPADPSKAILEILAGQNLIVGGFDVIVDTNSCTADPLIHIYAVGNDQGNANVYLNNVVFKYSAHCIVGPSCKAFQINGVANTPVGTPYPYDRRPNNIGIENVTVYNGAVGGAIKGHASRQIAPSVDNSTAATYRAYNATARNCSFVNMKGDGIILHSAEGPDSGMHNCNLSAYRYDSESKDGAIKPYQAGFWYYNCNGCVSENLVVDGMSPVATDRMAFDFDNQTSNCVFRYCVSRNNGGGLVLCVQNIDMPSGVTNEYDWFVTKGWGNNNNVIEYCISYNDGIATDPDPKNWWGRYHKVMAFNSVNNFTVRNCLFIDTVTGGDGTRVAANSNAPYNGCLLHVYIKGGFAKQVTLDSNIFYFANGSSMKMAADISTVKQSISATNNVIFSAGLGEDGSRAAFTLSNINMQGNIFQDPRLVNTTKNGPSGPLAAKLVTIMRDSPAIGTGTANANPDVWGNTGKNIGWQQ